MNGDISHNEVAEAISHLKQNKAGGPDTLIPEIFIHSAEIITPFLVGLFNQVFSSGQFPDAWIEAIIQPLHKKGNAQDPNNYRGISLLNVCSRLYGYILNKRLVTWIEENGSAGEEQAGSCVILVCIVLFNVCRDRNTQICDISHTVSNVTETN